MQPLLKTGLASATPAGLCTNTCSCLHRFSRHVFERGLAQQQHNGSFLVFWWANACNKSVARASRLNLRTRSQQHNKLEQRHAEL